MKYRQRKSVAHKKTLCLKKDSIFLPAAKRQGQVELNVEKKIGTYGF